MISKKLLDLIRDNTGKLGRQWARRIKESEHTKTYQKLSNDELQRRNKAFFENLVKWFDEGASNEELKSYFARIGRERYHEGIPLDEINFGIIIAKKVLWDFILSEGIFSDALAIYQALEMITMIYNYFDFGSFYIGREYLEGMYTKIISSKKFDEKELKSYLFPGTVITDAELEAIFSIRFGVRES
jgi:hypothetical protein